MYRGKIRRVWPFGLRLRKLNANMFTRHTMKYAKREFERRFLLQSEPPSLPSQYVSILDTYFVNTTLRWRRMANSDGTNTVYKLTQKKKDADGQMWITNLYLTEAEATLFRSLPSVMLEKRRYHIERGTISQAIDIVECYPEKIVLLEIEGENATDIQDLPHGFDVVREVTSEAEYTGYAIAQRFALSLNSRR
jgi:CYTH domain-containing protein